MPFLGRTLCRGPTNIGEAIEVQSQGVETLQTIVVFVVEFVQHLLLLLDRPQTLLLIVIAAFCALQPPSVPLHTKI